MCAAAGVSEITRKKKCAATAVSYTHLDVYKRQVFECLIDAPLAEQMQERLRKAIETESDSVFVFPLCDACLARSSNLGVARQVADPEVYIV